MEGLRSDEGEAVKVAKSCSDANSRDSVDDDVHTTPVQKRRHFTLEETDLISEYFGEVISRGATPSLAECKMFVERRNTSRTPKNIQDKASTFHDSQVRCDRSLPLHSSEVIYLSFIH